MEKIRIGIFGLGRGAYFIENFFANDSEVVAVCDKKQWKVDEAIKETEKFGGKAVGYSNFDEFIEHPMDAVYLANCFNEHAPYAIKALEKGIHVLSECTANGTMAEGVALVRAARKSNAFYMLSENYPFMLFNQEMRRVYRGGTLGQLMYAEGEYNHPMNLYDADVQTSLRDSVTHWRCYIPSTYYITHSLGPLCYATAAKPVRVTAMPIFIPRPDDCVCPKRADRMAVIMTQNDDASVFRVTGCATFGAHGNSYRICGTKGQIENLRGTDGKIMLRYNDWEIPEGMNEVNSYYPELVDEDAEQIRNSGHGGGDFFVVRKFLEAIRTNTKPEMDELFATRLSSVAILAHRSLLAGGAPFDIPDFSLESDCVKYENDRATPFWSPDGTPPNIPSCSHPEYKPSELTIRKFEEALERKHAIEE